jgi:hypothetical protein
MLKVVGVGVSVALTLSACAGRAPEISPLVLASDQQMTCAAIEAETRINNAKLTELSNEQSLKVGQNVVAGVAGIFIWPAWIGLDFQNAAGKEAEALSQRNAYLLTLARDRCRPKSQTASLPELPDDVVVQSAFASSADMQSALNQ